MGGRDVLALVAPDKLEKEDHTHSIKPSPRLSLGAVNFVIVAVRTALPSNLKHNGNAFFLMDLFRLTASRQSAGAFSLAVVWTVFFFLLLRLFLAPRLQELRGFPVVAMGAFRHEFLRLLGG
jgi:hypothetical protein